MVTNVYCPPQIVRKCVKGLPKKEALLGGMKSIMSTDSEPVQCLNVKAFRGAVFKGYPCFPSHVAVGWSMNILTHVPRPVPPLTLAVWLQIHPFASLSLSLLICKIERRVLTGWGCCECVRDHV